MKDAKLLGAPCRSAMLIGAAFVVGIGGCGSDEASERSQLEKTFAESVGKAQEAQKVLFATEATPPIFEYTPLASRTIRHLIDEPNLARVSEHGLNALISETTQARRTLRSTAEFQDSAEAREGFEAAKRLADKTFRDANAPEQAFMADWVELLEVGEKEASVGEAISAYLLAQRDLAKQAIQARRTGKVARANVTLAAIGVLRSRVARAESRSGTFQRKKEPLCDELRDSPDLERLAGLSEEFCDEEPAARSAKTRPSGETKPQPPDPPAPQASGSGPDLNENSQISTDGLGPVIVGMDVAEASKAAGTQLRPISNSGSSAGCQYFEVPNLKGVSFMVSEGSVARVDVSERGVSTLSGIRVGDPEDAVTAAYGDQVTAEPGYYDQNATEYTFTPTDPSDQTRVVITALGGRVIGIRAGRQPEVNYVEGCV